MFGLLRNGLSESGVEHELRPSQILLNIQHERMRPAEHSPRGPFRLLEQRHSLVKIVERRVGVRDERPRVIHSHLERESIINTKNAPPRASFCAAQILLLRSAIDSQGTPRSCSPIGESGGGCRRFHIPTYVSTVRHLPPGKLPAGPEKQSREQLDAVEAAYAALDAASRGDDALAAEIVSVGVFEASQRRREALLARNVTVTKHWVTTE